MIMMRYSFGLTAGLGLVLASGVRSDDWPEFRGPTGQGVVANGKLPTTWSPTRNVAWKQKIPGKGWSSPVVFEGRIYLTTAVALQTANGGKDQSLRALCLDAKTGKPLWDVEVFLQKGGTAPAIHLKNSHASPTPLVAGGRLYTHFGHQGTACLDLDGKVLWRNTSLKYKPVHGNGGTPVLVDDALIFSCDGGDQAFVAALNRNTGDVIWKTDRSAPPGNKFSFSTPLAISVDGRKQVISPGTNAVMAYDPATGKEIWRVRYNGYSVIPRPVFGHGLVILASGFMIPNLLAIRPDGHDDVTDTHVAWRLRKSAPCTPSPLVLGDEVYLVSDSGIASCLDAKTGEVHWQERVGGNHSASPIAGDGKVYFQSEDGNGVVVKAGKKFEQLARNSLGERSLASYAAVDGALFIRTEGNLYRIEAQAERAR
jgi:outer membrane protein assembly factor BamB